MMKKGAKPAKQVTRTPPPRSTLTFAASFDGADALPEVTSLPALQERDGELVRLVGTYTEVDVRMMRRPPPRLDGHVAIVLKDGEHVSLLPVWDDGARRPQAEADALRGKTVTVVGVVYEEAPEHPSGGASPMTPCIDEIKAIY